MEGDPASGSIAFQLLVLVILTAVNRVLRRSGDGGSVGE